MTVVIANIRILTHLVFCSFNSDSYFKFISVTLSTDPKNGNWKNDLED
jgi:hypothetical protein